jgi:signal peptidase I
MLQKKTKNEVKDFMKSILTSVAIALFVVAFVVQIGNVQGASMEPTFYDSEKIIIWKVFNNYERNDIIIFNTDTTHGQLIKRVIGLPGETVQIINNDIYINNEKIDDVIDVKMKDYGIADKSITLREGEYFVLGDNRNNSLDSRAETIGVIKESQIIGKVILRINPFTKF